MGFKNIKAIIFIGLVFCLTGCVGIGANPTVPKSKPDPMVLKLESYLAGTNIHLTRVKYNNAFRLTLPADITFQKNSTHLQAQFSRSLNAVARLLTAQPKMMAKITGHTDIYGTLRYNQVLSEKRAQTIANYLAARGIAKNRLQTAGYGITAPVASNKKPEGRAKNRRVEILLYSL